MLQRRPPPTFGFNKSARAPRAFGILLSLWSVALLVTLAALATVFETASTGGLTGAAYADDDGGDGDGGGDDDGGDDEGGDDDEGGGGAESAGGVEGGGGVFGGFLRHGGDVRRGSSRTRRAPQARAERLLERRRRLRQRRRAPRTSRRRSVETRRRQGRTAPRTPVRRAFAPNELVARGLNEETLRRLVGLGFEVLQRFSTGDARVLLRLRAPSGLSLDDARLRVIGEAEALGARNARVDLNHYYRASPLTRGGPPAFREDGECAGFHCQAFALIDWPIGRGAPSECGAGLRIGMIDTGVATDIDVFGQGRVELLSLGDAGPLSGEAAAAGRERSSLSHGTAVAALFVGSQESRSPGLFRDATVVAVDAFYRVARGDERSDAFAIAASLTLLAEADVSVVNMSLAGPANEVLEATVEDVAAANVVLVAAAGNAGPRAEPQFPAAYPGVISVTAIDHRLRIYRRAIQGGHIDFAAPGVDVWTAGSVRGARTLTGTSFAAPFVSAAAALVAAGGAEARHAFVRETLRRTARDLGSAGRDDVFGFGLIQASGLCGAGGE